MTNKDIEAFINAGLKMNITLLRYNGWVLQYSVKLRYYYAIHPHERKTCYLSTNKKGAASLFNKLIFGKEMPTDFVIGSY